MVHYMSVEISSLSVTAKLRYSRIQNLAFIESVVSHHEIVDMSGLPYLRACICMYASSRQESDQPQKNKNARKSPTERYK
jgi:hypothetical protein